MTLFVLVWLCGFAFGVAATAGVYVAAYYVKVLGREGC